MLFLRPFDLGNDSDALPRAADIEDRAKNSALAAYEARQKDIGYETMKEIERGVLLYAIDKHWRDHLYDLDGVRAGIGLRAYGQKNPLLEYKSEAFELFLKMLDSIDEETTSVIFHGRWVKPSEAESPAPRYRAVKPEIAAPRPVAQPPVGHPQPGPGPAGPRPRGVPRRAAARRKPVPAAPKVGRNDPCPCGSGKKYKKCCGR
jgi:preprotein translocase subunit SecA